MIGYHHGRGNSEQAVRSLYSTSTVNLGLCGTGLDMGFVLGEHTND